VSKNYSFNGDNDMANFCLQRHIIAEAKRQKKGGLLSGGATGGILDIAEMEVNVL
jgi:hypothetical protein